MRRWQEDYFVTYREWKKHHRSHIEHNIENTVIYKNGIVIGLRSDVHEVDCECDTQIGRFRKKDAWDCGNTRCYICHSDKYPKREKTRQEMKADLKFKEGKEDC